MWINVWFVRGQIIVPSQQLERVQSTRAAYIIALNTQEHVLTDQTKFSQKQRSVASPETDQRCAAAHFSSLGGDGLIQTYTLINHQEGCASG